MTAWARLLSARPGKEEPIMAKAKSQAKIEEEKFQKVLENLKTLSDSIYDLYQSRAEGKEEPAPEPEKPAVITLEQVRGVLADKSRAGFTAEVRSIIESFGANRLSEIDAKDYEAVLAKAEVLGDG